ncbi:response regulator transcription factor [Laedolimicola ammoniilytica]|uniref:Stage 0 sporulation protein A homolog n=1 Tax=Laedolimicola ammoniilytica TaxID=2981771 RepID=A0ABT2RX02_9FIRM|nr:response regulator transcription factor [Laedolimicola ammoniilytica]MCU6696844.1 response regulator transcription factor [Laedolimicola ammoniilytica]SCH95828.1 Transcriptional regulatory protein YycF [uncultured Clostridium sp.]
MLQILVVEDEQSISNLIKINLTRAGYACDCAYDGLAAVDMLDKKPYDLVLLDIMLPGADGYEIMDYIAPLEIPVIFLTAKASVADRVKGLRMGADDYLTKPFEIIELLARVESVLRRYHKTEQVLTEGDLVVDTASRTVTKKGETISLTKKEFDLLLLFVRNKNIALYRETIYERIWGGEYMGDSRTVDLHVQRMRKKAGLEEQIQTVYRVGYRYCP